MHQFDQDISLKQLESLLFKGNITENWLINGNPHGGYLMAIMTEGMLRVSEKKASPIITSTFISRCYPGEITLSLEKVSSSRTFERIQAKLFQDGKEMVRAFGTFIEEKDVSTPYRYETGMPKMAGLNDSIQIPAIPKYTLYNHMDVRLDPECAGWFQGSLSPISEHKGWIKFKEDRDFDISSVILMSDSFPPPVLASHGMIAWVPTIEFSINIRNIPRTKWLKCIFRTRFIVNDMLEEDGEIWDENGEFIAISRQIAQFRKIG